MYVIEEAPHSITDAARDRESDLEGPNTVSDVATELVASNTFKGLDLGKIDSRTELVKELTRLLPLNEYNLPVYIYRTDLLAWDQHLLLRDPPVFKQMLSEQLTSATIYLGYHQGYPTVKGEAPFWSKLEWESQNGFEAFLQYIDQAGARTLHSMVNLEPGLLREWYHQNYWHLRAVAFDAFQAAHHARLRERRIFEVEDQHYTRSKKLFDKVAAHLENVSEDELKEISFDKLAGALEKISRVQRTAVGLSSTGKDGAAVGQSSVEVVMRQIAERSAPTRKVEDNVDMDILLSDPEALQQAQELIIKVSK